MDEHGGARVFERLDLAVNRILDRTATQRLIGRSHKDADDVDGTIATDSAIGFDPRPLLRELWRRDARVVVMGQVAGILHGSRELTGDLDLLWDGNDDQAAAMADAFRSVSATLTDQDGEPVECDADAFRLSKVLFRSPSASGDCCTPRLPWGTLDIAAIIERADSAVGPGGIVVRYVSAGDLVIMRRAVGRTKDLRRAEELEMLAQES